MDKKTDGRLSGSVKFRMACIALLWAVLVYMLAVAPGKPVGQKVFWIIASGIIVFVPLYKKYFKKR